MTAGPALDILDRLHRRYDGPLPRASRACALAGGPMAHRTALWAARLAFLDDQARWARAALVSHRVAGDPTRLDRLATDLAEIRRQAIDLLNVESRPPLPGEAKRETGRSASRPPSASRP